MCVLLRIYKGQGNVCRDFFSATRSHFITLMTFRILKKEKKNKKNFDDALHIVYSFIYLNKLLLQHIFYFAGKTKSLKKKTMIFSKFLPKNCTKMNRQNIEYILVIILS